MEDSVYGDRQGNRSRLQDVSFYRYGLIDSFRHWHGKWDDVYKCGDRLRTSLFDCAGLTFGERGK